MYTDGLVERRGEPFDRGIERLVDAMEAAETGDLDDLCDTLSLRLLEPTASDDVAFLCLRVGDPGSIFSTVLAADPIGLSDFRGALRGWLAAREVDPEEAESAVLAANEAIANSIEHGYRAGGSGTIDVQARLGDGVLSITVRDRGRWRDLQPDPNRGRGIAMMRMLMDSVEIHHGGVGTSVRMRRRVADPAGREASLRWPHRTPAR
jgi:anti-sigma regulatory factor (Ser/Thr protein kinase)